jgi:membrane protease YdiL (CAAX protease family)
MTEKNPGFPSAAQALLLIAALFVVEYIVSAVLHDAQDVLGLTLPQLWALDALVANGLVFATVMQYRGLTYRQLFHPAAASMRDTALSLVPYVLFLVPALVLGITMLLAIEAQAFPLSDNERAMFARMDGGDLATLLMGCVIAPVVEEMLFRGIILRGFLARYSRAQAIWGSAALFGLAHRNIYQFVAALLIGAVSGWLYERARSLVPCIALHAGYNTALELLANSGSDGDSDPQAAIPAGLVFASVTLAVVGVLYLRRHFDRQDAGGAP